MDNPKRDKFRKLAELRTTKAVNYIRLLGNLGNRAFYEYGDDDVAKIISELRGHVSNLEKRLQNSDNRGGKYAFKLDE